MHVSKDNTAASGRYASLRTDNVWSDPSMPAQRSGYNDMWSRDMRLVPVFLDCFELAKLFHIEVDINP